MLKRISGLNLETKYGKQLPLDRNQVTLQILNMNEFVIEQNQWELMLFVDTDYNDLEQKMLWTCSTDTNVHSFWTYPSIGFGKEWQSNSTFKCISLQKVFFTFWIRSGLIFERNAGSKFESCVWWFAFSMSICSQTIGNSFCWWNSSIDEAFSTVSLISIHYHINFCCISQLTCFWNVLTITFFVAKCLWSIFVTFMRKKLKKRYWFQWQNTKTI